MLSLGRKEGRLCRAGSISRLIQLWHRRSLLTCLFACLLRPFPVTGDKMCRFRKSLPMTLTIPCQ